MVNPTLIITNMHCFIKLRNTNQLIQINVLLTLLQILDEEIWSKEENIYNKKYNTSLV